MQKCPRCSKNEWQEMFVPINNVPFKYFELTTVCSHCGLDQKDMESSFKDFQDKVSKYDNAEWIEEIVHTISAIGNEACDRKKPLITYK